MAGQSHFSDIIIQDFAELTLTVWGDRCRVHWEITKVSRKLGEGLVFYTIPMGEVDDEDEDLLHVGMCVLSRIYIFIGSYAIVQFTTLNVEGLQSQKPVFWIHTGLLHIPPSRALEAQWAQILFPGFTPSLF